MANIEFTTFTPTAKVNPYTETVEALAKLDDENAAVAITVPATDKDKESLAFQRAANAIGKTARRRLVEEIDKGKNVKMTFTLAPKHKPRRGK